jgi:hypothetical protein
MNTDELTGLERLKTAGFGRLLLIATFTSCLLLSSAYVRFPIGVLGLCGVLMTACALVIVENNLRANPSARSSRPHTPITPSTPRTPNGLLHTLPSWTFDNDEVAWTTFRDMAAIIALVCMLVSLSFESFKTWQWTYRDPTGPIDPEKSPSKVRVFDYEWNSKDDFWGIIFECTKAALMLLTVSSIFLYPKPRIQVG